MVAINSEFISGLVHTAIPVIKDVGKEGIAVAEKTAIETGKVVSSVAKKVDGKTGISDKYKAVDKALTSHVKAHPKLAFAELGGLIAVDAHTIKHMFGFDKKNETPQNSNGRSTATTLNKFSKDSTQISGTGLQNQASSEKTQTAEAQR